MSLEQKIEALTVAVIALTAAMGETNGLAQQAPKAESAKKPDTATTPKSSPAQSKPETPPSSTGPDEVTYDQVKESILAISSKNRDHAVALLQRYGAKSGKDLTAEQYAEFHADAKRVISGEYDPTEASDD